MKRRHFLGGLGGMMIIPAVHAKVPTTGERNMTTVSTHILDMVSGKPAPLVLINLFHGQKMIFEGKTDHDGRCKVTGLKEPLVSGSYQFVFHMAEYFKRQGYVLTDPPFLDVIRIDFGIAKNIEHYHVPLLVSPYGFSTYRGS